MQTYTANNLINATDVIKRNYAKKIISEYLIFPYGSRVYGTAHDDSDWDYIVVAPNYNGIETGEEYRGKDINITFYRWSDWQDQLKAHKIHCLEAYYLPTNNLCKTNFHFVLDKKTLRHELSEKASHSFVKAKKKIDVEKDYYIGFKSLFHSLRILNFGIQMATKNKIEDYSAANHYWDMIINEHQYEWDFYKEKYQPIYNELASKFREVAPK